MTLERPLSGSSYAADNYIKTSPLPSQDYLTVPRFPASSTPSKDWERCQRRLDRSISGQTVLSGSSTTGFSNTAWASSDSVDHGEDRKRRVFRQRFISNNTDYKSHNHSPNPHAYRHEQYMNSSPSKGHSTSYIKKQHHKSNGQLVNGYSTVPHSPDRLLERSASDRQREPTNGYSTLPRSLERSLSATPTKPTYYSNGNLNGYSTPPSSANRSFLSTPEKKTQRSTCSREVLLDFPSPMPKSAGRSSHSSAAKRSERSKEEKAVRNGLTRPIQPAKSMPGLTEKSLKDTRAREEDERTLKSCALFFFFRRKKKPKGERDRSPSPVSKSERKNTHRRPSHPASILQSIPNSERRVDSNHHERRPSSQSSAKTPHTPTSSRVAVNSSATPTATSVPTPVHHSESEEKGRNYISRSRPHRKGERRHRNHTPASRTQSEERGVRYEDLPPHPSLYKKVERTHSNPGSKPCLRSSSNNRLDVRRDSKTDSSLNNLKSAGISSASGQNFKDSSADSDNQGKSAGISSASGQNLKNLTGDSQENVGEEKSDQSASKTDPEDTTSSSEHSRRPRSVSLPNFGDEHCFPDADNRVITDAEDFQYNPTDMKGPLNLTLCGCGFLGMYHAGVVTCLLQRGPSFLNKVQKVAGASAGALIASVLVTARDRMEETTELIQNVREEMRKKPLGAFTPGYSYTRTLRSMLEEILPEDAHELAQGKLFVSLTNSETKKNELITDFKSREEMIEILLASCFIPLYGGLKIPVVRGKKYVDGGLTDNMPRLEPGRTITVSPFDGKSDIGPKQGQELEKKAHFINVSKQEYQLSMSNIKKGAHAFFPPKRHILQEYFEKGRYDASRFLIREGMYEIAVQPLDKKTVLYESSV